MTVDNEKLEEAIKDIDCLITSYSAKAEEYRKRAAAHAAHNGKERENHDCSGAQASCEAAAQRCENYVKQLESLKSDLKSFKIEVIETDSRLAKLFDYSDEQLAAAKAGLLTEYGQIRINSASDYFMFKEELDEIKKNNVELDKYTEERLNYLHPEVREIFRNFITELQLEFEGQGSVRITDAYRTIEEQNALYERHDGTTNAPGGKSYHNYGLAIDIVLIDNSGNPDYDNDEFYTSAGEICEKYGIEWGGNFTSLVDKPHFQYTYGHEVSELYQLYLDGEIDSDGYIILD